MQQHKSWELLSVSNATDESLGPKVSVGPTDAKAVIQDAAELFEASIAAPLLGHDGATVSRAAHAVNVGLKEWR